MASSEYGALISATEICSLNYKVVKWSSFSSSYRPSNILKDAPCEQASRWSSENNSPPQYLILELENPCILSTITFGKFEKTHVCNLKKFKIYTGLTEDHMVEVLDRGLQNDHIPETFKVKNVVDSYYIPTKLVKIVPLQSWGSSYNFSIWYVALRGIDRSEIVDHAVRRYQQHREDQAIKLCLKHLRQHNYIEAFEALRKKCKVAFEDPLLEELYQNLVQNGDYEKVESLIQDASCDGLFNHYLDNQELQLKWKKLEPLNRNGSDQKPGQRGGHQMVIDPYTETVYLLGGWDGTADLADFWSYHVPSNQWHCISMDTERDGGPSARSCHKMCLDYERRHLYLLGRYVDIDKRTPISLLCDFFIYYIDENRWMMITDDTLSMGGPRLVFDHQMCLDIENQVIYVFGGKTQNLNERHDTNIHGCSGLYSYHIPTCHWSKLRDDCPELRSRFGHSMLLNNVEITIGNLRFFRGPNFPPADRPPQTVWSTGLDYSTTSATQEKTGRLYIFSGQRGKDYFNDFLVYDIGRDSVDVISSHDTSRCDVTEPPAGFTLRATLDEQAGTIHVLLSMNRLYKENEVLNNAVWIFDLASHRWTCLPNTPSSSVNAADPAEPVPRFAHQFVFDHVNKVHYIFGGNPNFAKSNVRLDDFWTLNLCKPSDIHVLRQCRYLIRKYRFKELIREDPVRALYYLQNDLHEIVNHDSKRETVEFQKLTSSLFDEMPAAGGQDADDHGVYHTHRSELYEMLVNYFPPSMTQPKQNLVDLIK